MHSIRLTALSLAVLPFANAQVFVSTSTANSAAVASALSSISSLEALLQPPPSIASELASVPPSVTSAFTNPTLLSSIESEFISTVPSWYTALPTEAQAYVVSAGGLLESIYPQIVTLEAIAGVHVSPTTILVSGSTETVSGSMTTMATGTSSAQPGGPLSTASGTATGTASSSSSSAGTAPTAAVAAGLLGAMGFLGFAIAL